MYKIKTYDKQGNLLVKGYHKDPKKLLQNMPNDFFPIGWHTVSVMTLQGKILTHIQVK